MSLLTKTSLIVLWCILEVVNSHTLIPQPPFGTQLEDPGNQAGDGDSSTKDGKNPYKMFYIEKDHFRCEECDEKGRVHGNMTYLDGKLNTIRTVKYETNDIPLDPKTQENGAHTGLIGAQDGYQQPYIQGQQLQGQQMLQPIIQGQQLQGLLQPQMPYNGQPIQGQGYQGNQEGIGTAPMMQQQNAMAPQFLVPLITPNLQAQNTNRATQGHMNLANSLLGATPSTAVPYGLGKSLPDTVSPGLLGVRLTDNRPSLSNNQGLGVLNVGYPSTAMEVLAAEAIRNLQPQPPIQPVIPVQPQQAVNQALNGNALSNLAQRLNFMNSNGVDSKPQGASPPSGSWYQQPLFSSTSTGVAYNREPNGAYNFEFKTPDISRKEAADDKNNVIGSYAYRDPSGSTHFVKYNAGADQGFNAREHSLPGGPAPTVMPLILVPTQQQLPLALVAPANTPIAATNGDSADKTGPKDDDSAKTSDTDITGSMLQKLARQIVANLGNSEKDGNIPPATAEEESAAR